MHVVTLVRRGAGQKVPELHVLPIGRYMPAYRCLSPRIPFAYSKAAHAMARLSILILVSIVALLIGRV